MVGTSAGFKTALIADLRLPLAAYLKTDVPIVTHTAAAGTPEAGKLEFLRGLALSAKHYAPQR
jgi:hypothetical protein